MNWDEVKHFKKEEFTCPCGCGLADMDERLIKKLDQLREIVREPLYVNSGFRCVKHNEEVGGKATSAHLLGEACDLKAGSGAFKYVLLKAAYRCGFERIGIGSNFIHLDVSQILPRPTIWTY